MQEVWRNARVVSQETRTVPRQTFMLFRVLPSQAQGEPIMKSTTIKRPMVLSIHPHFAAAIMEGTKRVELRKPPFPRNAEAVLMYATSPARYIVGGFVIETVAVDT